MGRMRARASALFVPGLRLLTLTEEVGSSLLQHERAGAATASITMSGKLAQIRLSVRLSSGWTYEAFAGAFALRGGQGSSSCSLR
jgi:hypothetical protein